MTESPAARGERLRDALAAAGVHVFVEAAGTLAILTPDPTTPAPAWAEVRRDVVRIARAHGFSHVATEVGTGSAPAAASPGAPGTAPLTNRDAG